MKINIFKDISESPRLFIAAYGLLTVLAFLQMVMFRLIPAVDIPSHLAAATVLRHIGEPDNAFSTYFITSYYFKSAVAHVLFCSLPIFPSVEFANHIYFGLYMIIFPLAIFLVIRKIGGNPWLAIPAFLLIHNFNLNWGFANYVMGIPLVVLGFYFSLGYFEKPNLKNKLFMAGYLIFLYLFHALSILFMMLIFGLCSLYINRKKILTWLSDCLVFVTAVLLMIFWWSVYRIESDSSTPEYLFNYYTAKYFQLLYTRPFDLLKLDNYFLFEGAAGVIIASVISAIIIGLFGWGAIKNRRILASYFKTKPQKLAGLFLLAALGCFFILPHGLEGETYLYHRFSVYVLIVLVILSSILLKKIGLSVRILFIVLALANTALWFDYFSDFNRKNKEFTPEVFPAENKDKVIGAVLFDDTFRGQHVCNQFQNYHLIWNKAMIATPIVDYRFFPVRRIVSLDMLPPYNSWVGLNPLAYDMRFNHLDRIMIKGIIPDNVRHRFVGFVPHRSRAGWTEYRRQAGVDSPPGR